MIDLKIIIPFITLIAGVFLGFLSNYIMIYISQKNSITIKVVEHYFKIRDELCEKLSELAMLKDGSALSDDERRLIGSELLKIYFKYYDFIPSEVLGELNCLHACLADKCNRLFAYKDNKVLLLEDSDLDSFIDRISFVDNLKYYARIALKSSDDNERKLASIRFQARSVLRAINDNLTTENLMSWLKIMRKQKLK